MLPDSASSGGPWGMHWVAKAAGHEREEDLGKNAAGREKPEEETGYVAMGALWGMSEMRCFPQH